MKKIVPKSYAYMNNHAGAKSVANALELKDFPKEPITREYNPELVKRYPQLKGILSVEAKQDLLRLRLFGGASRRRTKDEVACWASSLQDG